MEQNPENETPKVLSLEVEKQGEKSGKDKVIEYLEEMLEIAEAEMQASTSPLANDTEEAIKQRNFYYRFKAIVKSAKRIA